jgi:hypothetical protein
VVLDWPRLAVDSADWVLQVLQEGASGQAVIVFDGCG